MAPTVPPLTGLMVKGWLGGLRWETKGYKDRDDDGHRVHKYRNLLVHPHSTHIAKMLVRNLVTRSPTIISRCFSDIYEHASKYVHLCEQMEPKKFWSYAKRSWEWSEKFKDDAFWALTHKLFLARALYLDTVPVDHRSTRYPLVGALDLFRERFYAHYGPGVASRPIFGTHPSAEELERVQRQIAIHQETRDAYFQYSQVDSEGDGSDRLKTTRIPVGDFDPNNETYYWWGAIVIEPEVEDIVGFYFDLGQSNPRHGHKDAYQEIQEALDKDEEEDERARKLEKEATGLEEDMMDVDAKTAEDDLGDIGMGGLGDI